MFTIAYINGLIFNWHLLFGYPWRRICEEIVLWNLPKLLWFVFLFAVNLFVVPINLITIQRNWLSYGMGFSFTFNGWVEFDKYQDMSYGQIQRTLEEFSHELS